MEKVKKLSHCISRGESKINPFVNEYTYSFKCYQYLEKTDSVEGWTSYTNNEFKEILVDNLVSEFKTALNSVVFGDPAGKAYIESLKNKNE